PVEATSTCREYCPTLIVTAEVVQRIFGCILGSPPTMFAIKLIDCPSRSGCAPWACMVTFGQGKTLASGVGVGEGVGRGVGVGVENRTTCAPAAPVNKNPNKTAKNTTAALCILVTS